MNKCTKSFLSVMLLLLMSMPVKAADFENIANLYEAEELQSEAVVAEERDMSSIVEDGFTKETGFGEFEEEEDNILIQDTKDVTEKFLDPNFCKAVQEILGTDTIMASACAEITELNVSWKKIEDLSGIEYFTSLEKLECQGNQLRNLDLSSCRNLRELNCFCNGYEDEDSDPCETIMKGSLETLNLRNCSKLETVLCGSDDSIIFSGILKKLDLSGCSKLKEVDCSSAGLEQLIIDSPELQCLYCSFNDLSSLEGCSKAYNLKELECVANELVELDLSCYPYLTRVACGMNKIQKINCSLNSELADLSCWDCDLAILNVSNCKKLEALYCSKNRLAELIIDELPELKILDCSENKLKKLEINSCKKLETLDCDHNQIQYLGLTNLENLTYLKCSDNLLTELRFINNENITSIVCDNNRLLTLEVNGCKNLEQVECSSNELVRLDFSGCHNLEELSCCNNEIKKLDVSENKNLYSLYCSWNRISNLNVSNCKKLYQLFCDRNRLQSFDITGTSLFKLDCSHNYIKQISDIKGLREDTKVAFYPQYQIQKINIPTLNSIIQLDLNKVKISWRRVEDAEKYHIYRKIGKKNWKKIATVNSDKISFIDTAIYPEEDFEYSVSASGYINGKQYESDYYQDGLCIKIHLQTPWIYSAEAIRYDQIELNWVKAECAGYRIYRRIGNGKWERIAQILNKNTTKYIDKSLKCGMTYTYAVRSLAKKDKGNYVMCDGYYEISAKAQTPAPKLKSINRIGTTRISLQWTKVSGASGYRIYRKSASDTGDKWENVGTVNAKTTAFTDKTAKANKAYRYTVRSYRNVNKKKVWGGYEEKGLVI